MGTRKIGPAVAAGCTMVVKPAELTPLTMLALAGDDGGGRAPGRRPQRRHHQQLGRAQQGADGRRPAAQGELHRLDRRSARCWSGSPPTSCSGCRWSSAATRRSWSSRTPTSTPPSTARWSPRCATWGRRARPRTGSSCTSRSPRSSPQKLGERMGALTVGRGQDEGVDVGPLINAEAVESVGELVTDAVHDGATRGHRRRGPRRAGQLLPADGAARRAGRRRRSTRRRSSARSRRSRRSRPRRRRSSGPTRPSTA